MVVTVVDDNQPHELMGWAPSMVPGAVLDVMFVDRHGGVSKARNLGASVPGTDYLAFLDADDVWISRKLERSIDALDNWETQAVCTSGIYFGDMNTPMVESELGFDWEHLVQRDHILTSPVMHRSTFDLVGGFDPTLELAEDLDFALRALEMGVGYIHVPEPLVFYRKHPGAATVRRRAELLVHSKKVRQAAQKRMGKL